MAFKLEWKPVLQALALKEYHPAFDGNVIQVCVNPTPNLWQERQSLMAAYSKGLLEAQAAAQRAGSTDAAENAAAFNDWCEKEFLPVMQSWFARVWSFGDEQFTVDDLNEYEKIDPHLVTWLKRRSIEMITEHEAGRKKA